MTFGTSTILTKKATRDHLNGALSGIRAWLLEHSSAEGYRLVGAEQVKTKRVWGWDERRKVRILAVGILQEAETKGRNHV